MTGLVRGVGGGFSALFGGGRRPTVPDLNLPEGGATQEAIDVADEDLANLRTLNRREAEVSGRGGTILTGLTDTSVSTTGNIQRPSGGAGAPIEDDFIEEVEETTARVKAFSTRNRGGRGGPGLSNFSRAFART